jgi:cytochrome c-type biogenesis protein
MIDAPLAYAFGVGMVATVNPCGFAMLPAYLSFFLGLEGAGDDARTNVLRALVIGATITAGFVAVFGVLGIVFTAFSVSVQSTIESWLPWLTIALGLFLVGLGAQLLRGRALNFRVPTPSSAVDDRQLASVFVFGVSYALVSLSCTIPLFLAVVSTTFTDKNFASGVATYLAYALGMGVVLVTLTVALALARQSLVRTIRRALPYVYKVSGALLVAAGAYVAYYGWYELRVDNGDVSGGGPANFVFRLNGDLSDWIQRTGPVRIGIVLAAATGVAVALVMSRRNRSA